MKRILEIFIFSITSLSADSLDTDVNHVIVDHKGNSFVAIIDSMDLDAIEQFVNKIEAYLIENKDEFMVADVFSSY